MHRLVFWVALPLLAQGPPPGEEALRNANQYFRLAEQRFHEGKWTEAEGIYGRAIAAYASVLNVDHPLLLTARNNLAATLLQLGRPTEAEGILREVAGWQEKARPGNDLPYAVTLNNLGEAFAAEGKIKAAIRTHEKARAIRQQKLPPESLELALTLEQLGEVLRRDGQRTRAESLLRSALAIWTKGGEQGYLGRATTLNSLAHISLERKNLDEAQVLLLEALQSAERIPGASRETAAGILTTLALVHTQKNQLPLADQECRRALAIIEADARPQDQRLAAILSVHAQVLDRMRGHADEARQQQRRADMILSLRSGQR